jgi:hypothetical protein
LEWLIPALIWLLVGLTAVAVALGVMVFAARRMGVNGDDGPAHNPPPSPPDGNHEPHRPKRPPPGGKATPLNISLVEFRGLRPADFRNDSRAVRDFGEMITAATLAVDGWKKLPSKLKGGQGLDILVVRDLEDGTGFEARAIEVKTNVPTHNPGTMSDERVAAAIAHLHRAGALDAPTSEELIRGVMHGPPYFRKQLWHHQLVSGVTTIWELDEDGKKTSSQLLSSAHLMDALFQLLKQFDRNADDFDRHPGEPTQIEEVYAARRAASTYAGMNAYSRTYAFRPKRRA